MKYLYYPGCSLEGTAREYDISTRAFMKTVGASLVELEDWTCCGATAAEPTSYLLSLALPARNLALAGASGESGDILAPCSACYLNLKKAEEKSKKDPDLLEKINTILDEERLRFNNTARVRHLLDVMTTDIGSETIRCLVKNKLAGLVIAPYYGCQCLRPYPIFDDPEDPRSMEPLITAVGATVHPWAMGGKCCGASNMNTKREVGMERVAGILKAAKGADAIVTVCPMCQINLEGYQKEISKKSGEDLSMTILYLPQLIGLALGASGKDVGLQLNLSVTGDFRRYL